MDREQKPTDLTQALPGSVTKANQPDPNHAATQIHRFRCTCGSEFQVDPQNGGICEKCQRKIPAAATRSPLSMTVTRLGGLQIDSPTPFNQSLESENDPLIGKHLGHFEILGTIGQGGMGHVYRALDTSLQRYVAVKVIRSDTGKKIDDDGQQLLLREAIAQARVNHPNIVTIYYVGQDGEIPFLAMELIDGYDASDLTRQGQIPYDQLCQFAIKITQALQSAAELGIVHADIKPQNLLVLKDGNIKLSDFGMARFQGQPDESVGGTPNYLAPELLSGGQPTIQSDMYALGATLFEMTFGHVPIQLSGSTVTDWTTSHQNSTVTFPLKWPDHLPEGWRLLLQTLLQKDPSKRYKSYKILGEKLALLLPSRRQAARDAPRVMAFIIDYVVISMLALPAGMLAFLFRWDVDRQLLLNYMAIPAILIFILSEYWWRQTIGHELMHVKIVNRYGLTPSRKQMALRSFLRLSFVWGSSIRTLGNSIFPDKAIYIAIPFYCYFAADILHTLIFRGRKSLTDRLTNTKAVVGSDSH